MNINYASYVRPDLVLRDIGHDAKTLARVLEAEISGVRDGDGTWHGSDGLLAVLSETAPRLAALAALYLEAVDRGRLPPDESEFRF